MQYWLLKSEPDVYSIVDLKRDKKTLWEGVRNYQARNYMQTMRKGDHAFFYHSSCDAVGIVGLASVSTEAIADPLQFDAKSEYYDKAATPDKPRWFCVQVSFVKEFKKCITLEMLRNSSELQKMVVLQKGSRLSVQPVTSKEYNEIIRLTEI